MTDADLVVVGAGIIGLATARAWQIENRGSSVVVVDAATGPAAHQSGHNSGVLHAGVYYPPGSLKAALCTAGRLEMERFCDDHDIPCERPGKLIVATDDEELERLAELARRAESNGLAVERLDAAGAAGSEPHVRAVAALRVAETGTVDFRRVVVALVEDVVDAGGEVLFGMRVDRVVGGRVAGVGRSGGGGQVRVDHDGGVSVSARRAVVCAGVEADRLARRSGVATDVRIIPFRGEYAAVGGESAGLVNGLIYPVPDPRLPFLGVHLTRSVDGSVHAGPNAVMATARHGYRWRDVDPGLVASLFTDRRTWRLARRWWRTGAGEVARSLSRRRFAAAAQRLVPDLDPADLSRGGAGVRAQAVASDGTLLDDFEIVTDGAVAHVLNAPSPGATASLAIGRHLTALVGR